MPTPTPTSSPTPTPTSKACAEAQGEPGGTTTATMTARPTALELPAPLDTNFDSDSDSPGIVAVVPEAGGGFHSEAPLDRNEPPVLAAKDSAGPDSCIPKAAESTPAITAVDVDFDSDSPPARTEAVVTAPPAFTAADIDFDDSDSSAAPPVSVDARVCVSADPSSPRGAADNICADFDLDHQVPTADCGSINRDEVDELRRRVSHLQDGRGGLCGIGRPIEHGGAAQNKLGSASSQQGQQHDGEEERYPTAPVGTVEELTSALQGGKHCGGRGVAAAHKRKRCGTVFLAGGTADRGFCASSLSQR